MRPKLDNVYIYETALPFFARYGYKKTTLDDIAGALDMSNTNLYSYAKNKRDLYDQCVSYAIDQWQEFVRQSCAELSDPREKLVTTFRSAVGYLMSHEDTKALLQNDPDIFPMFPSIDPIEEYNDWSVSWVQGILQEGIDTGVFREMNVPQASVLMFNFYKYLIISCLENTPDEESMLATMQTLSDLVFHGLLKGDS